MKRVPGDLGRELIRTCRRLGFRTGKALVVVLLVLLSIDTLSSGLLRLLEDGGGFLADQWGYTAALIAAVLVLIGVWIYLIYHEIPPSMHATDEENPQPRRVLILLLSAHPNPNNLVNDLAKGGVRPLNSSTDLGLVNDALSNWRMPLEAIRAHLPKLERVVVIYSSGTHGSCKQFPVFRQLVESLLDGADRQVTVEGLDTHSTEMAHGCDFEDVSAVWRAIESVWNGLIKTRGLRLRERDVLVDITGGTKKASVAAALFTQAQGRRCQYVRVDKAVGARISVIDIEYDHEDR
ncbi:hypothetical protein [Halorhodospira halophila]|uniref:Uncharacterized protein n=1 Tax=Halorhodospira halophila (strain DSM 244 / SL1) TaxID=349124 RepID=A1WUQ6_HALHL|nr:hypothetical protein [Halorhodospira halophila]ABM61418.1 hypothetical protein Hhal_0634 [Halorhodospira halophila SL1]MBK1728662.1 hypothetical protein [Halorhodospira halophila]